MPKLSLAKLERHLYSAADRLRQEGLDAATYKDYIFGLFFLKRCSDVFDAERERIVGRKVEQGMTKEIAEIQYGENPDYYDGFFLPERARWMYLQDKLGDATEPYGGVLDKALGALSEANESLEHVLDHISFMRVQGNKRIVSDDACKDLVRHFSRHRLPALHGCLPEVTKLLMIGWRATEVPFVKLLAEKLRKDVRILAVAGGLDEAKAVVERLQRAGCEGHCLVAKEGFTEFIAERGADELLRA